MKILPRRARGTERQAVVVEAWGPDAIGANQVESLMARNGALLAGFTAPTPAGWGMAGSTSTTDSHVWASPQAFNMGAANVALSTWAVGAAAPTVYPGDTTGTNIVLPGRGGV